MRKLLLLLAIFACALGAKAADAVTAKVSGTSLKIGLTNETSYVAFQMDITLPAGVDATAFAAVADRLSQTGEDDVVGGTKFIVATNKINETTNTYRVIAYNLANAAIAGTSGQDILAITLSPAVATPSDVKVSNIKFVKQTDLTEVAMTEISGIAGAVRGDINGDEKVNVLDLGAVIDIMLGKSNSAYNIAGADLNGDTKYNVLDLGIIIDIMLGK